MTTVDKYKEIERIAKSLEPYDVLQITYDDGARWDDYCSLKDAMEISQGVSRVVFSRGQPNRFRIVGKGLRSDIIVD